MNPKCKHRQSPQAIIFSQTAFRQAAVGGVLPTCCRLWFYSGGSGVVYRRSGWLFRDEDTPHDSRSPRQVWVRAKGAPLPKLMNRHLAGYGSKRRGGWMGADEKGGTKRSRQERTINHRVVSVFLPLSGAAQSMRLEKAVFFFVSRIMQS